MIPLHQEHTTMKRHDFLSDDMKMADLICRHPKLLQLLSRFGITIGFGDQRIGDTCRSHNVNPQLFLLIVNVYYYADFSPKPSDLETLDVDGLLTYLQASHHYYLNEKLPHIENHINHIADSCPPTLGLTLRRFYQEYKSEVISHIEYEEHNVFPYLQALRNDNTIADYHIGHYLSNHIDIEDKLNDLVSIMVKYLPGDILPTERINLVGDIIQLSEDLSCHNRIEEQILIPYVESLEASLL